MTSPPAASAPSGREYPEHPRLGVGAVVLHEDRVLLVRRGQPPAMGTWSLPGGLVDLGETVEDAAVREVAEECGIAVHLGGVAGVVDRIVYDEHGRIRYHYVVIDYLAHPESTCLTPGTDAAEACWVAAAEVHTYAVTDAVADMIRRALRLAEEARR